MPRALRPLLAALFLFVSLVVAPLPAAAASTVSGRVTDLTQAGAPGVPDIKICLGLVDPNGDYLCQAPAFTDSEGYYAILDVAPGDYIVGPPLPGEGGNYAPTRREVTVGTGPVTNVDFAIPSPLVHAKTEEIAHRADRVSSPENSATAIERAITKGATNMEIDVVLAADGQTVVVSHGSRYRDEKGPIPGVGDAQSSDAPTQVYGPTASCFERNLETDSNWRQMVKDCDIGSEMMILPDKDLSQSWLPVFKDERFPILSDVLQEHSDYCGWMIELKETEISGTPAQIAARDQALGAAVQQLLESSGTIARCAGNTPSAGQLWVTSFSDAALGGVTNPAVRKMRQVYNPILAAALGKDVDIVWEVDNAIIRGYEALNVDLATLAEPAFSSGPSIGAYIRSKGLLVSAYTLSKQTPAQNSNAIARQADYFMTDILDDLLVQNGDRSPAHVAKSVRLRPTPQAPSCRGVFRNFEVFPLKVNLRLSTATGQLLGTKVYDAPALTTINLEFLDPGVVQAVYETPTFTEPSYEPITTTTTLREPVPSAVVSVYKAGNLVIAATAEHASYPNVEPDFTFGSVCGDEIVFTANGVRFPTADGSNPAIVGTNCVAPGEPELARNIAMSVAVNAKPSGEWTLENVKFYLDGGLLAESAGGGGSITLPAGSPILRDLAPGEHTFRVTYTARKGTTTRSVDRSESFTVALKEPDPVSGKCLGTGDIQVTLSWASYADLDLHVIDPYGEEIYYGRTTSASGGTLDVDANAGCSGNRTLTPVENIYWPYSAAPSGTYQVRVVVWSTCGVATQPYTLRIRVGDQTQTYTNTAQVNFSYPASTP